MQNLKSNTKNNTENKKVQNKKNSLLQQEKKKIKL